MCFETASCLLWGVYMGKLTLPFFNALALKEKKEGKKLIARYVFAK